MANIALVIGNTEYQTLPDLDCCAADLEAIHELLKATERYDAIEIITNSDSFTLKERIRSTIDAHKSIGEIFFYFTGHGFQHNTDFFFCACNFDSKRPNETGLSNSELHTLLRSPDADLVVKVIDACNSGTLLVKANGEFLPIAKQGFKNVIQIASCLDSQNSLTGNPLSLFTEKFRAAVLRKSRGPVYYTDIVDALRDEFLNNDNQTPHFVSQGTGREQFVEDAARLDPVRTRLSTELVTNYTVEEESTALARSSRSLEVLERAQREFATKDTAQNFISNLFDNLTGRASNAGSAADFFSSNVLVHSDFVEEKCRNFIIRSLANEKRPDNFVHAAIVRPRGQWGELIASMMPHSEESVRYELRLNCTLEKAQVKITLTPKFTTLKQLVLIVSCAPSLERCYVFSLLTQHSLKDWNEFDEAGEEISRHWWKLGWTENADQIVSNMWQEIEEAVEQSVEGALQSLGMAN